MQRVLQFGMTNEMTEEVIKVLHLIQAVFTNQAHSFPNDVSVGEYAGQHGIGGAETPVEEQTSPLEAHRGQMMTASDDSRESSDEEHVEQTFDSTRKPDDGSDEKDRLG